MCITEYNEEETMQLFKEEGLEEGIVIGKEEAVFDMFLDGGITKEYAAGRLCYPVIMRSHME